MFKREKAKLKTNPMEKGRKIPNRIIETGQQEVSLPTLIFAFKKNKQMVANPQISQSEILTSEEDREK